MLKQNSISGLFKWCVLLSGISVILGAFGAHVLSEHLSEKGMDTFNKAGYYLLTHSIATMLFSGNIPANIHIGNRAVYFIFFGAIIFSLSLYTVVVSELTGYTFLRKAGIIAPIGGTSMVIGWLILAYINFKNDKHI